MVNAKPYNGSRFIAYVRNHADHIGIAWAVELQTQAHFD